MSVSDNFERNSKYYNQLQGAIQFSKNGKKFSCILEKALKDGYPIDFVPIEHYSHPLLSLAFIYQKPMIVRILRDAGADVNIIDNADWDALMYAIRYSRNRPELICEIADKIENINRIVKSLPGGTALNFMCLQYISFGNTGYLECAKYLLNLGADPVMLPDFSGKKFKEQISRRQQIEDVVNTFLMQKDALEEIEDNAYEYEI